MGRRISTCKRLQGLSLIEALISLMLLSFAVLGLVGLQARMLAYTTDAQQRVVAAGLVDLLLSHAAVDPKNANCYVRPVPPGAPACSSAAATAAVDQWLQDVSQLSEGQGFCELITVPMGGSSFTGTNQQMRARVLWRGRSGEMHRAEGATDVR
jgi:type IV pilus assembly protein PilV